MKQLDQEEYFVLGDNSLNLTNHLPRLDSNVYVFHWLNESTISVSEVFSIQSVRLIVQEVGIWSLGSGLHIPVTNKWDRRFKLTSAHLQAVTEEHGPYMKKPAIRLKQII